MQLTTEIALVAEQVTVDIKASPFSIHSPRASIDLAIAGIKGAGLTAIRPDLAEKIDGSRLKDGAFSAKFSANGRLDRRSPLDFSLANPAELDLVLRDVRFQGDPNGETLLGLDELRVENARIDRDEAAIDVKNVELTKPIARIWRDGEGIHALGLWVKLPAAATQPADHSASEKTAAQVMEPRPSAKKAEGASKAMVAKVRKFSISGIDAVYEDRSAEPALLVPLTGLEFEAHGLASDMLTQERLVRYNLLLSAGKVPLAGRGTTQPSERELFAEIASTGRLALGPRPSGYVSGSITGFDLTSLRGLAAAHGITLANGLFDESLEARFRADGTGSLHTRTAITDLSISEPPKGPIAEFFGFPTPLNVAIAAIQAPDGSITLPVDVGLKDYAFGPGDVAAPAMAAITQAVTLGIASTPLKLAGGLFGAEVGYAEESGLHRADLRARHDRVWMRLRHSD